MDSIFDLSPSEKLQLVEDLWDDLAATPTDIPVYDWQVEELCGERPISNEIPNQPYRGKRSREGFERPMAAKLIVAPEAELDLCEAYVWYERQRIGLGEDFLSSVDVCIQRSCRSPENYEVVHISYRRARVCVSLMQSSSSMPRTR